mmetsp:Transcript_29187/g.32302  ORF Transcript_29187/g.32302 Transcript_29187/m.32302 type:complete len:220 (+) Transcript_29187:44-703(+)|eukprot:CAMPEP_0194136334 /NCGR_PEP_ID=MMETSP0152-20130528/6356_1 /TAXON_ID=1049557 /ORGANISM="Thalassiothrix antarctica, Strain L6-D1" /LENGTH=219 /DNA_ID=CAMNT_0038832945 /DNA_START=44 /DNA_END=703 /DNA_ORIENTATION=-
MGDEENIIYANQSQCPSYAACLGYMGVVASVTLSNFGSAYGTWQSGVSMVHTGIRHPSSVMKNVIPIVMAGVIGIYGLIVGVILGQAIEKPDNNNMNSYSVYSGLAHLCAGLCTGLSGLAAGMCIGVVGDYGIRAVGYRTSQITVFNGSNKTASMGADKSSALIPEEGGGDAVGEISGSEDQNKLFVGMLIMLIFSEALALYGMIIALIVSQNSYSCAE